ncbi:hypothetical protein [Pseudomonas marginalis]|uniref:hypothetical protein n=1 Tax=Pseudomonas marginalis TaxID=298 RepID=UPI003BA1FCF5
MAKLLRIAVIGSGFSGSIFAKQIERYLDNVEIIIFEKNTELEKFSHWTQPEQGAALHINPNGMSTIKQHDIDFYRQLRLISTPRKSISVHSINKNCPTQASIPDIVDHGLADDYGAIVRWEQANSLVRQRLVKSKIHYNMQLVSYSYDFTTHKVSLNFNQNNTTANQNFGLFDLLVGADGRYSTVRKAEEYTASDDTTTFYNVSNFRLLIPNTAKPIVNDLEMIYNVPVYPNNNSHTKLTPFKSLCRIGLSFCPPTEQAPFGSTYLFGNFALKKNTEITDTMKRPDFLKTLFMPYGGEACLTPHGQWLMRVFDEKCADLHWSRFQSTPIKFTPEEKPNSEALPILYLGDAAHAFPPSLGQGATSAIEDAYVASGVLLASLQRYSLATKAGPYVTIISAINRVSKIQKPRIALIRYASVYACNHLTSTRPTDAFHDELDAWATSGLWIDLIRDIWKKYPRPPTYNSLNT